MRTLTKTGAVCLMAAAAISGVFANPEEDSKKPHLQRANIIGEIIEEAKLGDNDSITYEQFAAARDAVMKKKQEQVKAEREKRQKERFMAMDKDKDGKISKAELLEMQKKMAQRRRNGLQQRNDQDCDNPAGQPQRGRMQRGGEGNARMPNTNAMILRTADKNNDGVISKEELQAATLEFFEKFDADKDGKVSPEELRAARKARAGQQGEHHARGERGGRKPAPQTDDKE
ncbi:MAG: EF-hand domain-containing protein [Victivallales bacterium]|nr:EF-hand domain-containing protein [Victivallales bacterium]